MAKTMPGTDTSGNDYTSVYWVVVEVNMNRANKVARILLYPYKSRAAWKAGKVPLQISAKAYDISEQTTPKFSDLEAKLFPTMGQVAYGDVINATKDVPAPTPTDPNAKKNFFEGATDVMD